MSARALPIALAALVLLASAAAAQDAEILSWDQTFTWKADGSLIRRDHRRVRINSPRAYRDFADPRIDYEEGRETVTIHKAVTHLADGTELPVPPYSFNTASPGDVVGWPAWANWRQKIVTFSGLEPGVVVELDYEVESEPRVHPWLEASLQLEERYPILTRTVTVIVPEGTRLRHRCSPEHFDDYEVTTTARGDTLRRWSFGNLPALPDEPRSPPRSSRCSRLAFTTVGDDTEVDRGLLGAIDRVAVAGEDVDALSKQAAKGVIGPEELARKLARTLKDTLHLIRSQKTWRSHAFRPAEIVLREGYGSPPELASLMTALLRRAGYAAFPALLVDEKLYIGELHSCQGVLGNCAIQDFLVLVDLGDDILYVHPVEGPLQPRRDDRDLTVIARRSRTGPLRHPLPRRFPQVAGLDLTGRLALDATGKLTGRLMLTAAGLFFDPKALRTEDGRKAWLGKQASGLISGLQVRSHTVELLSPDEFRATMEVTLDHPWMKHGRVMLFRTGDGPLFLRRFPLPLGRSDRRTSVRIDSAFREHVDVVIDLPAGWSASPPPEVRVAVPGSERAGIRERTELVEGGVRLRREIQLPGTIPADAFQKLRTAINDLRSRGARTLVVSPRAPSSGR